VANETCQHRLYFFGIPGVECGERAVVGLNGRHFCEDHAPLHEQRKAS
jgi:hypothetical protein